MPASLSDHLDISNPLVRFALTHLRVDYINGSRQKHEHGYRLEPRTVPDINLIYVTRGRVVWEIDDVSHELKPGEMVIVPPGVHHFAWSETKRVTLGSIHVEATLPDGQDVFALLRPERHQSFADRPLASYLHGALREFDRSNLALQRTMLEPWARLVTLELLRDNAERGLLDPAPVEPIIIEVLDKLDESIAEPVRLEDLSEWSGFSPQHLNRMFKRSLGVTPLTYLARARMDRAAELIAAGRLTIAAVGEAVGHQDPYYFSRVFKQHHGLSPSAYQSQVGSDSPSPLSDSSLS